MSQTLPHNGLAVDRSAVCDAMLLDLPVGGSSIPRNMLVLIRLLVVIALTAVAVAPPHVHASAAGHGVDLAHGHAEHHGAHGHDATGDEEQSGHEAGACCASLSAQCGTAAVVAVADWTAAELALVGVLRDSTMHARADSLLPDFEPPPPRA